MEKSDMLVNISIIVPVHNAETYIKETVESILIQEAVSYELLLVDNRSTDGSLLICQKYEKKYDQIHVLSEEKKGAGAARNRGLRAAKGEYICFVDADDLLSDAHALSDMYEQAEKSKADIVVGNYKRLWDGKLLPAADHQAFSGENTESEQFRFAGFFTVGTLSYVWGKLYKRAFLTAHDISFQNYSYAEDKLFNMRCYALHPKYAFISHFVYIYRKNPDSVSFQYRPDSLCCWLQIAADTELFIKDKPQYGNLPAYTLFFAAFFDAKMEYIKNQHSIRAAKDVLRAYAGNPIGQKCYRQLIRGMQFDELHSFAWKCVMRAFSLGMVHHFYGLLAFGIKLLIDLGVDERLSDTGVRE